MVRALENLSPERILQAFITKHDLYNGLITEFKGIKETPTGVMLKSEELKFELDNRNIITNFSYNDLAYLFSMLLLRNHGIITIPAVGMPGTSSTIRIDLASNDAERISTENIVESFNETLEQLIGIIDDKKACKSVLYY